MLFVRSTLTGEARPPPRYAGLQVPAVSVGCLPELLNCSVDG